MLKVFRWAPEKKSPGHVAFREIRIYLQRTLAVEFSLFQPRASWIEFEMASGAHRRKNGVAESKARVSTYSIGQVIGGLFDHRAAQAGDEQHAANDTGHASSFRISSVCSPSAGTRPSCTNP